MTQHLLCNCLGFLSRSDFYTKGAGLTGPPKFVKFYLMFAVIKTGGKQYKVAEGDKVLVEKINHVIGEEFDINQVLLIADSRRLNADLRRQDLEKNSGDVKLGQPFVGGASVRARVLDHIKGDKKIILKYHSKTRYKKKKGHMQPYTRIEILTITA